MTTVATPIIDKNGKATTVHKKAELEPATRRELPQAPISPVITERNKLRLDSALELLEDLGDSIVVGNQGMYPHKRPTVSLNDMEDGDVARGNCWSITNELIEIAGTDYFGDYVDELSINTSDGLSHTALFVKSGDDEYVIDYTARQFGNHLDFPLIVDAVDWKPTIEKAYGKKFEYTPAYDEDDEDEYEDDETDSYFAR